MERGCVRAGGRVRERGVRGSVWVGEGWREIARVGESKTQERNVEPRDSKGESRENEEW